MNDKLSTFLEGSQLLATFEYILVRSKPVFLATIKDEDATLYQGVGISAEKALDDAVLKYVEVLGLDR